MTQKLLIGQLTRFWSNKDICKQVALLLRAQPLVTILPIMVACIVDSCVGDIADESANK